MIDQYYRIQFAYNPVVQTLLNTENTNFRNQNMLFVLVEVHGNLTGPWPVMINNTEFEFNSFICMNSVTDLAEITQVKNQIL